MPHTKKVELITHMLVAMEDLHKNMVHVCPSEKYDITPLQLSALKYLSENSSSSTGALGAYLHLSSSATTQLGERLVTAGLIKRDPDPNDRRAVLLSLTRKGKKICLQLLEEQKKGMIMLFEYMSEKDLEDMVHIVRRLTSIVTYQGK